jgi:hypothetical protein
LGKENDEGVSRNAQNPFVKPYSTVLAGVVCAQ